MKKAAVVFSMIMMGSCFVSTGVNAQSWVFEHKQDKFTDERHYLASTRTLYHENEERLKIAFECRDESKFVFTISTDRNLAAKEALFEFRYRVDKEKSKKIKMRAFTNSSTGGMNRYEALELANDIVGGQKLLARVIDANQNEFDAVISLEGSSDAILRTARACGYSVEKR